MGGSILRSPIPSGRFAVATIPKIDAFTCFPGLVNSERSDQYKSVSWGTRATSRRPKLQLVPGLLPPKCLISVQMDQVTKSIGTGHNCSGGHDSGEPSCWENFQASSEMFVGVTEAVKPDGTQTEYTSGTTGAEFGLVGEKYGGWLRLIHNPDYRYRKHTALGRFRHENMCRVESGKN